MRYKSLPAAFLFQTLVGALCIFSISLFGPAWFATIAILGLRPFILKRVPIFEDSDLWKFYYKIGKISMVATALTIIFVYTVLQFKPNRGSSVANDSSIFHFYTWSYWLSV